MKQQGVLGFASVNALVFAALGVGLLNNVLIAALFGLTTRVDAFFGAMMLPSLFMFLCVDYLGKNFLPMFATAKQESDQSASQLTSTIVTAVAMLAATLAAVLFLAAEPVFSLLLPGFEPADVVLAVRYFQIMAPAMVLMAVTAFHEYVCQYEERFTQVVAIRAILPLANLFAILALGPTLGEYSLPVGFLVGHVATFALMARAARYRYVPSLRIRAHLERRVFVNSAILMSTGVIAKTRTIVMNAIASTLGGGAITALAFALKLTDPLGRVAFTAARMVMFSRTAKMFVDDDRQGLARLYATGLRMSILIVAPVVWWVVINSEFIVNVMFVRGEFTPGMSALVSSVLIGMAPSVLFAGVGQLVLNAFYAMDRIRVPAIVMPLGMLVYVGFALALTEPLGTQGLALATSATSLAVFLTVFVCLARALEGLDLGRLSAIFAAYVATSGASMLGTAFALEAAGLPTSVAALAGGPLGFAIHAAVLRVGGDEGWQGVERYVRELFARRRAVA